MGLFIAFYNLAHLLTNFFLSIGKTVVSYLAAIVALLQIAGIWSFHSSLLSVIQISLAFMAALFLVLSALLIYNFANAKKV